MGKIIKKITEEELAKLIKESEYELYYCSAGVNKAIGDALKELAGKKPIHILCDVSENNSYFGLSDFKCISELKQMEKVGLRHSAGINITFVSNIFDFNYIWFPISKIFMEDTKGYNVIEIEKSTAIKIISNLWELEESKNKFLIECATETIKEGLNEITNTRNLSNNKIEDFKEPDNEHLGEVEKKLTEIPPTPPDLKRQIELINRTLQFIKVEFKGSKIENKTFNLPNKIIPFINPEMKDRIEARMSLFKSVDNFVTFKKIKKIENELLDLREKRTFFCKTKQMRLIKLKERKQIKIDIENLENRLKELLNDLSNEINEALKDTENLVHLELFNSFKKNPPRNLINKLHLIPSYTIGLVEKILPKPYDIVKKMEITYNEYDIAIEDYSNEKFLLELADSDFLTQEEYLELFKREKAIAVKKKNK